MGDFFYFFLFFLQKTKTRKTHNNATGQEKKSDIYPSSVYEPTETG